MTEKLQTAVMVSWDGSAAFTGPYDNVSPDIDGDPGLVITGGRDGAQQLSPPRVASGSFELLNESGKYSQERADSPIYQRIEPNKPVQFNGTAGTAGVWDEPAVWDDGDFWDGLASFSVGRHMIDSIDERSHWGDRHVRIETIGYETILTRAPVTVPLMTNPRVDQCVSAVLDAAAWPAGARRIEVSDTTLLYWWCDARNPWDALLELLASEGPGLFGVDRDGNFYFESRNHRGTAAASTTPQAAFSDQLGASGLWYVDLSYTPAFKNIFNRATYITRRRTTGALQTVWSYGAPLSLGAGASTTLIARPNDPFLNAVTPADGVDYTVSGGTVSISLNATSGFVAFITITATSGTPTLAGVAPNAGLALRAQPLTVVSETSVTNRVDASASIARYSPIPGANIPITLPISGWPEIDPAMAQSVCDAWVLRQQWPRPVVTFTLRNADANHVRQMVVRRVSDRVSLVQSHSGLATDVWINSLELRVSGFDSAIAELIIGAEKCDTLTGAIWDVSSWNDPAALWGV